MKRNRLLDEYARREVKEILSVPRAKARTFRWKVAAMLPDVAWGECRVGKETHRAYVQSIGSGPTARGLSRGCNCRHHACPAMVELMRQIAGSELADADPADVPDWVIAGLDRMADIDRDVLPWLEEWAQATSLDLPPTAAKAKKKAARQRVKKPAAHKKATAANRRKWMTMSAADTHQNWNRDIDKRKTFDSLCKISKWTGVGCDDLVIWGECRASQDRTYHPWVSLLGSRPGKGTRISKGCSCSDDRDCAHIAGLLWVVVNHADKVASEVAAPKWLVDSLKPYATHDPNVAKWLAKQSGRPPAKKKTAPKTGTKATKPEKKKAARTGVDDSLDADGLLALVHQHERPFWLPRTEATAGSATASKFGGTPWLADPEDWPACPNCGEPMQHVVQLACSKLPKAMREVAGRGLIQLFACTNHDAGCDVELEGWKPRSRAHVVRRLDPGRRKSATPAWRPHKPFREKVIVGWTNTPPTDLPAPDDWRALGIPAAADNVMTAASRTLESGPVAGRRPYHRDKLGGWPAWVQRNETPACRICKQPMHPLLQLASRDQVPIVLGDLGVGHLMVCPAHPDELTFGWASG